MTPPLLGQTTRQVRVTRRAALASLVSLAVGCTSRSPDAQPRLQAEHLVFLEPSYDLQLKLNVSFWAAIASAAVLERERAEINRHLKSWYETVVPSFSNALVSALQARGVAVERLINSAAAGGFPSLPIVRSFLTAGFVYKTVTSSTYAPFVQVYLQMWNPNLSTGYRQLYVATGRQFNHFMPTLPAATPFLLADIASLSDNPAPALGAFRSLAEQLGQKFAADLVT